MANCTGGASTICPFYKTERPRHIVCNAIEGTSMIRMCFNDPGERVKWQKHKCFTYEYENKCPVALALISLTEPPSRTGNT